MTTLPQAVRAIVGRGRTVSGLARGKYQSRMHIAGLEHATIDEHRAVAAKLRDQFECVAEPIVDAVTYKFKVIEDGEYLGWCSMTIPRGDDQYVGQVTLYYGYS